MGAAEVPSDWPRPPRPHVLAPPTLGERGHSGGHEWMAQLSRPCLDGVGNANGNFAPIQMAMLRDRSRCSGFTRRLHMFMLSRILISFVTLVTLIGSNIADWN